MGDNRVGYYYDLDDPKKIYTKPDTGAQSSQKPQPAVKVQPFSGTSQPVEVVFTRGGMSNKSNQGSSSSPQASAPAQESPKSPEWQQYPGVSAPQSPSALMPYQTRGTQTLSPNATDRSTDITITNQNKLPQASSSALQATSNDASYIRDVKIATTSPDIPIVQKPYDRRDDISFGGRIKEVFKNYFGSSDLYRDVAQQATGSGQYQAPSPVKALGKLFSPLNIFGSTQTIGEQRTQDLAYSGTGIYNPVTGNYDKPSQYKGSTAYERLQTEVLINPDIALPPEVAAARAGSRTVNELKPKYESSAQALGESYQSRINAGEITLEQANELYNKDLAQLQSDFEKEAATVYIPRASDAARRSSEFREKYSEASVRVAPEISSIATTSLIIGTSFLGSSQLAAARAGYRVVSGAIAFEGASNVYEGVANRDYLKVAVGGLMFAGGSFALARSTASEVTIQRIDDVTMIRPRNVKGIRTELRENYFQDTYGYRQATGQAQATTRETVFSEFNPQTNTFKIISGSSETTVKTTDFWSGRQIFAGSYRTFQGQGGILPRESFGVNSEVPGIRISQEGLTPSFAKVKVSNEYSYIFKDSLKTDPFVRSGRGYQWAGTGGESKSQDNIIYTRSGPGSLSYEEARVPGLKIIQDVKGSYTPDTFTMLKVIKRGSPTEIYFEPAPSTGLRGNIPPSSPGSISQFQVASQSFAVTPSIPSPVLSDVIGNLPQQLDSFSVSASSAVQGFGSPGVQSKSMTESLKVPTISSTQLSSSASQKGSGEQIIEIFEVPAISGFGGSGSIVSQSVDVIPRMDIPQIPRSSTRQSPALISPGQNVQFNPFTEFDGLRFGFPDLPEIEFEFPGSGPIRSGKQRLKYTPDFESLFFNIEGKAPTGGAAPSPFVSRPIPQGFSFAFSEGPTFEDLINNLPGLSNPKRRRKK